MQVHFGTELLAAEWPVSVACIGTFDGVHLGHQKVIATTVARARTLDAPAALITFDRHPAAILAPDRDPPTIATLAQNLECFEALGVAVALILPFTYELSQTPAQTFFDLVVREKLRASEMVIGHDFAFGRGREGNAQWLESRIPTHVVPPFLIDGERVSSTAIRKAILEGQMGRAARLLGRPWSMSGIVSPGQKLGRTLGFPTLNLARSMNQIVPRDGVYAGRCRTPIGDFDAAIGIGLRPTVAGTHRTIEAFLLDYPGESLYGASVVLSFDAFLRDELAFDSLEALREQMTQDVEAVRRMRSSHVQSQ